MDELGQQSIYTCPDCGGALWEIGNDEATRFRCFTGHVYNESDLLVKQEEKIEDTLWTALRMMEEKKNLALKLESKYRTRGFTVMAARNRDLAKEMDVHITRLRNILFGNETGRAEGSS
jgi:two-component system chemotaxis response regulator CheB